MLFQDLVGTAVSNLGRHRLRTILTVAGVAIGTTTLALMLSVAAGLQSFAIEQTQSMMASDLVTISSNPDVGSIRINVGQIGAPAEEIKEEEGQTQRVKPISVDQIAKLKALPHVTSLYASFYVRSQSISLLGLS